MAVFGLAHTNPALLMNHIDVNKWRIIVYAEQPAAVARYKKAIETRDQTRRTVLLLFGAVSMAKVVPQASLFDSVVVVDDTQNLEVLKNHVAKFEIVDVKDGEPVILSQTQIADLLHPTGLLPTQVPLVQVVTNALSRKRPSVLESQGKIPPPAPIKGSGLQAMMVDMNSRLTEEDLVFGALVNMYAEYVFGLRARESVAGIEFKVPGTDAVWSRMLSFGDKMKGKYTEAFEMLRTAAPDVKVIDVCKKVGLVEHRDDLLYMVALYPPSAMAAPALRAGK